MGVINTQEEWLLQLRMSPALVVEDRMRIVLEFREILIVIHFLALLWKRALRPLERGWIGVSSAIYYPNSTSYYDSLLYFCPSSVGCPPIAPRVRPTTNSSLLLDQNLVDAIVFKRNIINSIIISGSTPMKAD